jgi:thiol-disulfide isomerase/thioredoxin
MSGFLSISLRVSRHQRRCSSTLLALGIFLGATGHATAQMREEDPAASQALAAVIKAVRAEPRVIREKVVVSTVDGDDVAAAPPREAVWTFVPKRGMVGVFDGFRIVLSEGRICTLHDSSEGLFFENSDGGSRYYALLNAFSDLPWPALALALGEPIPAECAMQLHSRAPWLQPTSVEMVEVDGVSRRRILLSSDYEKMQIDVDPKTDLPVTASVRIHDGLFVKDGIELEYDYTYEIGPVLGDVEMAFRVQIRDRQRVDSVAALARPAPLAAGDRPRGEGLAPGRTAPAFDLPGLGAEGFTLADLKGKVVVLDFWATWCGPCRAALPGLTELSKWGAENGLPLEVIAVNTSEQSKDLETRRTRITAFLKEQGPALDDLRVALDLDGKAARAYRVRGLPTTVIIDAEGRVVSVRSGFGPGSEERLREDILDLFEGGDPAPRQAAEDLL